MLSVSNVSIDYGALRVVQELTKRLASCVEDL